MKIRIYVLTAVLLLAILFSAGCVSDKDTYRVGYNTEATNPLLILDVQTGEPGGPTIDMMNWVADDLNIKFEYVPITDSINAIDDDIIDITPWVYVNEVNKNKLLLSDFYLEINYGFVTQKSSDITVDQALSGDLVISCEIDSINEKWLKSYFGDEKFSQMEADGKIIRRYTVDAAIVEVMNSNADVCFSNTALFTNRLIEMKSLKYIGSVDDAILLTLGVKPGNTELIEKLNKGLADFAASDYSDEFANRYGYFYHKDNLIVGITDDFPPFAYLNEKGIPTGFDVDSMNWIADKYGFNVEYKYMPWSEGVYAVKNYEIDMYFSSLTITNDRSIKVTFSNPYYSVGNAVAQIKGSGFTAQMFENGELSIGVIEGTTPTEWILEYYGESKFYEMVEEGKILFYEDNDSRDKAFINGKFDLIFSNTPYIMMASEKYPIEILKTYKTDEQYGVAIQNGDTILLEMINKGLADLESSGKKAELLEKYNLD